jgi:hypothetical protein
LLRFVLEERPPLAHSHARPRLCSPPGLGGPFSDFLFPFASSFHTILWSSFLGVWKALVLWSGWTIRFFSLLQLSLLDSTIFLRYPLERHRQITTVADYSFLKDTIVIDDIWTVFGGRLVEAYSGHTTPETHSPSTTYTSPYEYT